MPEEKLKNIKELMPATSNSPNFTGDQYEQIGIVSFGSTLGCESGAPAGFTEVTMYRDWISSVTGIKV